MKRLFGRLALVIAALSLTGTLVHAVITAKTPLRGLIGSGTYVVVAKVDKINPEKLNMVLVVDEDLKGKIGPRRLPMVLKGDSEAAKLKHVPELLKRLAPDLPLVLFINQRAKVINGLAFTNGTWFQFIGSMKDKDSAILSLTHGEPFLRRTFKGTTAELKKVIVEAIQDKKAPPEPDDKEEPGFGPEIPAKKTSKENSNPGPVYVSRPLHPSLKKNPYPNTIAPPAFALIPTVGMAPLAILAALFPSVFGGVLVLFRQWMAFFVVLSVNSTLLILSMLFGGSLRGSWWSTHAALWLIMTAVTLLGVIWAWRRQVHHLSKGPAAEETPQKTELVFLGCMFLSLLGTLIFFAFQNPERLDPGWNLMIVLTIGVGAGFLWKLYPAFIPNRSLLLPRSTEGIVLSVVLLPSIIYAGIRETSVQVTGSGGMDIRWQFISPENGLFVSSPLLDGEKVYIAAAHPAFKVGTMYCLHRWTGANLWEEDFIGDGEFKQVFSSPTIAAGKLYIGEGFHDDPNCQLYCIDAATGKLAWKFLTAGQVESSPMVADGKVYFGGGNDGFYCADAKNGDKVWKYPPEPNQGRLLRFGASPLVDNGKVYVGTGVDRNRPDDPGETAVFCLDAANGKVLWKRSVDLPAWAAPVLEGDRLYVTLGNGDIFTDAANAAPAGAALCLNSASGEIIWQVPVANGVLERPVLDEQHVYFGSRDNHCYALRKTTGDLAWKTNMESPVIAGVTLARGMGKTRGVYAVGSAGKIACLHPLTGQELRSFRLQGQVHLSSTPRLLTQRFPEGDRQQIFLGAGLGDIVTGKAILFCLEDRAGAE